MQTEDYLLKLFNDSFQILWPIIKFVHQIGGILYNLPLNTVGPHRVHLL